MPEALWSSKRRALRRVLCGATWLAFVSPVLADCAPEPQGDGRVASAIDARTLRLDDGRIVRLAGLAPLHGAQAARATELLTTLAVGRTVSLHSDNDTPDRYGRQRAWVFAESQPRSIQAALIASGGGLRDIAAGPAECRQSLELSEQAARTAGLGLWAVQKESKIVESPDDISVKIGHFNLVTGRVRSVRTSGGTTYLNFGRRWSDGFAVTVPNRAIATFDAAGLPLKGFEGKIVRVRGYAMKRGGSRIEALSPDQIEVVGGGAVATAGTRD